MQSTQQNQEQKTSETQEAITQDTQDQKVTVDPFMFAKSLTPLQAHTLRQALIEVLDPLSVVETLRTNKIVFVDKGIRVVVAHGTEYNEFMSALFEREQLDKINAPRVVVNTLDSGDLEIQLHNFKSHAVRSVRSILHVSAGSQEWEPTGEEIEAVMRLFMETEATAHASIVTTRSDIHPTLYNVTPDTVLVVTVGSSSWSPTDEELAEIKCMFMEARSMDPIGSVVATRPGINIETKIVEKPVELVEVCRYEPCAE